MGTGAGVSVGWWFEFGADLPEFFFRKRIMMIATVTPVRITRGCQNSLTVHRTRVPNEMIAAAWM
jgi:hypothetical protein